LLHWCEKLSVGVPEMDHQHCQLVEMLNELDDAVRHGCGLEKQTPLLKRLIKHTVSHFQDEETYMQSIGFPEWEEHKREHERLIAEVEQRYCRLMEGKGGTQEEMLAYLLAWTADHIQVDDMMYAEYAQKQNVTTA